jgi:hypothetical protein
MQAVQRWAISRVLVIDVGIPRHTKSAVAGYETFE